MLLSQTITFTIYISAIPTCVMWVFTEAKERDVEFPYSHRKSRSVDNKCKNHPYGMKPHVKIPRHVSTVKNMSKTEPVDGSDSVDMDVRSKRIAESLVLPIVNLRHTTQTVGEYWNERNALVHVAYVNNPGQTVSVYEPLQDGTCQQGSGLMASVLETASTRGCLLAVNAGFFNTTSGECFGNIVSDGRLVQDTEGIQNAHFGITRDGALYFGYLSEIDVVAEDFQQLVGGAIWVLKDKEVFVDESMAMECEDVETTGTLSRFASVVSARMLVGHDEEGRLMIVQVEGKTDKQGMSLYEAAQLMKDLGAVNAINLDGGGSTTMVVNNTLVNYPSDWCSDKFQCIRNVSTVLCVHEPLCDPADCGGHGHCDLGVCRCQGYWAGQDCSKLECPDNCTGHGVCTEDGCMCLPGYEGETCTACRDGSYGYQCRGRCACENSRSCDPETGICLCTPGFTGNLCQYKCKYGYYGDHCSSQCSCTEGCGCDHVTGVCNVTETDMEEIGECLARKFQNSEDLDKDMKSEYQSAIISLTVISVVAFISLTLNFFLMWKYCSKCKLQGRTKNVRYKRAQQIRNGGKFMFGNLGNTFDGSFSSSISSDDMETSFQKNIER